MPPHLMNRSPRANTAGRRTVLYSALWVSTLWLAGCAVQFENREASQALAQLLNPPGSVYTGWRVFQDRCAKCHGADATGTGSATNLLPRVREMGERRFVGLVLKRYDWNLPPSQTASTGEAGDAWVEDTVQRKGPVLVMPAWQGEPIVSAHIADLYAYLSARAAGTQGPGRPLP